MPYQIAALPIELQQRFLPDLPAISQANIYLAADYFHNENYWEDSCRCRWGKESSVHSHGSWKLTYIERNFQEMIENYVPLQSDPNILLNDLLNIGEYVLSLKITQLLPPVRHTFSDFAAMIEAQLANHVQFGEPCETGQTDGADVKQRGSMVKEIPMVEEIKSFLDPTKVGRDATGKSQQFPGIEVKPWSEKARIKFQEMVTPEMNLNRGIDEGVKLFMNIPRDLDDTPSHPHTMNPFLGADHMNLVPVMGESKFLERHEFCT
jgi:hypothetical protein